MGNCASRELGRGMNRPNTNTNTNTARVIDLDGMVQEFRQPIKALDILSQNPNCFLCSLETMFIGSHAPHVPHHEELQLGQIYFLMPISKSQTALSLQDLCALAIKASTVLDKRGLTIAKTPFSNQI